MREFSFKNAQKGNIEEDVLISDRQKNLDEYPSKKDYSDTNLRIEQIKKKYNTSCRGMSKQNNFQQRSQMYQTNQSDLRNYYKKIEQDKMRSSQLYQYKPTNQYPKTISTRQELKQSQQAVFKKISQLKQSIQQRNIRPQNLQKTGQNKDKSIKSEYDPRVNNIEKINTKIKSILDCIHENGTLKYQYRQKNNQREKTLKDNNKNQYGRQYEQYSKNNIKKDNYIEQLKNNNYLQDHKKNISDQIENQYKNRSYSAINKPNKYQENKIDKKYDKYDKNFEQRYQKLMSKYQPTNNIKLNKQQNYSNSINFKQEKDKNKQYSLSEFKTSINYNKKQIKEEPKNYRQSNNNQRIDNQIQKISNKIKQFQQEKKKLNIDFKPYEKDNYTRSLSQYKKNKQQDYRQSNKIADRLTYKKEENSYLERKIQIKQENKISKKYQYLYENKYQRKNDTKDQNIYAKRIQDKYSNKIQDKSSNKTQNRTQNREQNYKIQYNKDPKTKIRQERKTQIRSYNKTQDRVSPYMRLQTKPQIDSTKSPFQKQRTSIYQNYQKQKSYTYKNRHTEQKKSNLIKDTTISSKPTQDISINNKVNQFKIKLIPVQITDDFIHGYSEKDQQKIKYCQSKIKQDDKKNYKTGESIRKIVKLLSQQVRIDQELRNSKIWIEGCKDSDKWDQLQQQLKKLSIQMTKSQIQKNFIASEQQNNPFFTIQQSRQNYKTIAMSYKSAKNHWEENIKGKFTRKELVNDNFQEKIDLEKKGYFVLGDFVRLLNMETGTLFRNRDLILIFKRLAKGERGNFTDLITILCN